MNRSADSVHPAEALLRDLGVTEPDEIDLDVIAQHVGAIVRVRRLRDCEARVTGRGNRAIISVDDRVAPTRRRFSIAHELGHWLNHRGYVLTCRASEIGSADPARIAAERVADRFAANLLLPFYLLTPRIEVVGAPDWVRVQTLAKEFGVSPLATALQVIDSAVHPAMLVCHSAGGRAWFRPSSLLNQGYFPRSDLDPDSPAFALLYGNKEQPKPTWGPGKRWFERGPGAAARVQEHSVRFDDAIHTLLVVEPSLSVLPTRGVKSTRR